MHLTPKEQERLLIFTAAEMARRRKAKGVKLNYPEAVAYISDEIQEKAREGGALVAELIQYGALGVAPAQARAAVNLSCDKPALHLVPVDRAQSTYCGR